LVVGQRILHDFPFPGSLSVQIPVVLCNLKFAEVNYLPTRMLPDEYKQKASRRYQKLHPDRINSAKLKKKSSLPTSDLPTLNHPTLKDFVDPYDLQQIEEDAQQGRILQQFARRKIESNAYRYSESSASLLILKMQAGIHGIFHSVAYHDYNVFGLPVGNSDSDTEATAQNGIDNSTQKLLDLLENTGISIPK
jgi:hypothetical protein